MGETDLSTVEETSPQDSEPPLGAYHGPTSTPQPPHHHPQPPSAHDGNVPPLTAWHTLTAAQVAQALDADTRYVLTLTLTLEHATDWPCPAMGSTSSKLHLASASMGLTRLRELKGYPCLPFS